MKTFGNYYAAAAYAYEQNKKGKYTKIIEELEGSVFDGGYGWVYKVDVINKKMENNNGKESCSN